MNIGFFGDGEWAKKFLNDAFDTNNLNVIFIVLRFGEDNSVIRDMAIKKSIHFYEFDRVNSDESTEILMKHGVDLFVSISYDQIFKRNTLKIPKLMAINTHAGLLPFYRGRNPINWAIINDEKFIGLTVHSIDEGIDTGDIILQELIDISEGDYYDHIVKVCVAKAAKITLEAIKKIGDGSYALTKQVDIHPYGFYCIKRRVEDQIIDWSDSSANIYNHIRALHAPGLYAKTFYKGESININMAKKLEGASNFIGIPGSVIAIFPDKSFFVKTGDNFIQVCAQDSLGKLNIRVGEILG